MNSYVNINGSLVKDTEPIITANSRAFRYGDGLFETMKSVNGHIPLEKFHFERLFSGMKELNFERHSGFNEAYLNEEMKRLTLKNEHTGKVRIRLMVFRGNGGLYADDYRVPHFLIESYPLTGEDLLNEKGIIIDIYQKAFKSQDIFSAIKSNNFLPYAMAAIYAKEQRLDDCLLLNTSGRICDATIANIFIIKNNIVYTPQISEGCIAGVMRRYLLEHFHTIGISFEESTVNYDQIADADEMFLTNAVSGIRWVKICGNISYDNTLTKEIHQKLVKPLFE